MSDTSIEQRLIWSHIAVKGWSEENLKGEGAAKLPEGAEESAAFLLLKLQLPLLLQLLFYLSSPKGSAFLLHYHHSTFRRFRCQNLETTPTPHHRVFRNCFSTAAHLSCYTPAVPEYRYFCSECGKTYIGVQQPGMQCNCTPPKTLIGAIYVIPPAPISDELMEQLRIQQANERRAELCEAWGITNFSHQTHGSNFSAPQTLLQLINNIVAKLQGATRARVKDLIIQQYQFDIDTQKMT